MKTQTHKRLWLFLLVSLGTLSCKALGSLPLSFPSAALPETETNADAIIDTLKGKDWYALGAFVEEQYTEEELAKPGTFTYTAKIKNDKPTYFNYGWCTTTEEILKQNYQHITVELFFDGKKLGDDVVHILSYTRPDGLICGEFGVLFLKIPAGTYRIEAVATFDEKINDGLSDYDAGEYFYEYHVTVEEQINPQSDT
jgi:hypothetical protein